MVIKRYTTRCSYVSQLYHQHWTILLNLSNTEKLANFSLLRPNDPTKHYIGHIGDGFYGSNDPTK